MPVNIQPFSRVRLGSLSLGLEDNPPEEGQTFWESELGKQLLEKNPDKSTKPQMPFHMTLMEPWDFLNLAAIESNSAKLRAILQETCPGLVSRAEQISQNVIYFPVSTFGHRPVELTGEATSIVDSELPKDRVGQVVPDPSRLNPFMIQVPTLWIMSHALQGFVPTEKLS